MSDELKACPFCGSAAREPEYDGDFWSVDCTSCQAYTWNHDTSTEAIAAWNRRTVTREQYEEMVYELHSECRDLNYKQACAATVAMLRAAGFEVAE